MPDEDLTSPRHTLKPIKFEPMTDLHANSYSLATKIDLSHSANNHAESFTYGSIGPDNRHDVDWFKVDLLAGNKYEIKLTGGNLREPQKLNLGQISVYTKDSLNKWYEFSAIYQSNNTQKRGRVRIDEIIKSEEYWVKIEGIESSSSSQGVGSYSLKVEQYGKITNTSSNPNPIQPEHPQNPDTTIPFQPTATRPTHTYQNFSIKRRHFYDNNMLTGPTRYGDTVKGSKRSDTLRDGYGPDVLIGGKGRDSFYISAPDGFGAGKADVLSDFGRRDKIVLSNSLFDPRQKTMFARSLSRDKDVMSTLDFDIIYFEDTGELFLDSNGSRPGYGDELDGGLILTVEPLTNIGKRNIIIEA